MTSHREISFVITRLSNLLDAEKKLLLKGQFDKAPAFTEQKDALGTRLTSLLEGLPDPASLRKHRDALQRLGRKAEETAMLLTAARAGASQARERIKDVLSRRRNVGVYGQSGDKVSMPEAGVSRTKLA